LLDQGVNGLIASLAPIGLPTMFDYDAWREFGMPGAVANGWTPAPPGDSWHNVFDRWVRGDDTGNPIWINPTGPVWEQDATECTVTGDNWGPQTWYPNIRAPRLPSTSASL
jgi:hypothetical protein